MAIQLHLIDLINNLEKRGEPLTDPVPQSEQLSQPATNFATDVSRAVYSALVMRPIYELEALRFPQGDTEDTPVIWGGVDLLWIAFAILDAISELSEYQLGATRTEVLEKILPLTRGQALSAAVMATDEGLYEVLNKVFDHLANRRNRYLPFQYDYFEGTAQKYRTRKFWLIKTVYTGEGREALFTLTDEGYAAYFGLHETSALDATAIGNLRIKLLIERGNVDDAICVADGNRKQCARKALEVRNTRRLILRNIRAVAFDQVQALAQEGVAQATEIQTESSRLHNMVIENLTTSQGHKFEAKLHRLAERLEKLNQQLVNLSGELQHLPDDYHAHSHKLFRRRAIGTLPPMDEVLGRIASMGEVDAARIGVEFISRIDPPAQRPLFDPAAVIDACDRALERQNVPGDRSQPVLEVDGVPVERFVARLDEMVMRRAFEMVHLALGRKGAIRLSTLLADAAAAQADGLLSVAVAMAVFQCMVERRLAQKFHIKVEMTEPEHRIELDLPAGRRYRGHDLWLKSRPISPRSPMDKPVVMGMHDE